MKVLRKVRPTGQVIYFMAERNPYAPGVLSFGMHTYLDQEQLDTNNWVSPVEIYEEVGPGNYVAYNPQ